jgi:hypothetical protein
VKTLKDKIKKLEKLDNWHIHLDMLCLTINLSTNKNRLYQFLLFRQRSFYFKDLFGKLQISDKTKFKTEDDFKSILTNMSKFYGQIFFDLYRAKEQKFRETLKT